MRLVRVVAPHFVAGFETDGETVIRAAPILRKALQGRSEEHARQVIKRFGWKASVVEQFNRQDRSE